MTDKKSHFCYIATENCGEIYIPLDPCLRSSLYYDCFM